MEALLCFSLSPSHTELKHAKYYRLNVCVPKSLYVEALIINMMLFGGGVFER